MTVRWAARLVCEQEPLEHFADERAALRRLPQESGYVEPLHDAIAVEADLGCLEHVQGIDELLHVAYAGAFEDDAPPRVRPRRACGPLSA